MIDRNSIYRPLLHVRAKWLVARGNRHRARRDWPRAADCYKQALRIDPSQRPIWVQLGHALKESGSNDEALYAYRRARELFGTDGDAPFQLGALAKRMGQVSTATAAFVQAIRENADNFDARRELLQIVAPRFDEEFYKGAYPDVNRSGLDPLVHYVEIGQHERRATNAAQPFAHQEIRHLVLKELPNVSGLDVALLVAHAPAGRVKPHVLPYVNQLRGAGLVVLLVVVVDRPLELLDGEIAAADGIIVRDNGGYDFGAWADGFRLCPALFGANLLVMTNDSVIPTADTRIFRATLDRLRLCPADIAGLTASHEYGWHLQSYFLGLKPKALSSWAFQHFIRDIKRIDDKNDVILTYEVPFAGRMHAAGLTVKAIFDSPYPANPTFFSWRELIEQGFPFIKLLMLRKEFAIASGWPEIANEVQQEWHMVARSAGFDVDLVRAAVRSAEISSVPAGSDSSLVVGALVKESTVSDHPLRIAFFGPWNYANRSGSVSRGFLCALQRTGIRLNAYPALRPFLRDRLICPAAEITDFAGQPDISIVPIDPDSWNGLTDSQREIVLSAKQCIGYWAAETDGRVFEPPADFQKVSRIWAPSLNWAQAVGARVGVPVDVVPWPVSEPAPVGAEGQRTTEPKAALLSYGAVADAIKVSFTALTDSARDAKRDSTSRNQIAASPEPPHLSVDLSGVKRFGELRSHSGVVPVSLAADLTWNGDPLPDGDPNDWLFFAPRDAGVSPDAIDVIRDSAAIRPDVVLFYADDVAGGEMMLDRIRLKPDFDRTLFVAQDYIGAPVIIRRRTLVEIGGLDPARGTAVLFDLVLRVDAAGGAISRITKVLIGYDGNRPVCDPEARRTALVACNAFHDMEFLGGATPLVISQRRRFSDLGYPAVSIVIPTRRTCRPGYEQTYVECLLTAIAETAWPMDQLTVIVGDDLQGKPDWATRQWPYKLVHIETTRAQTEAFNYAQKMNRLWPMAESDHVIFLNDDVVPIGPDWLAALVSFSSDEGVGGVSGRLYYENGSIQHAGIYPSFRTVIHAWLGWPASAKTYQDWAVTQREWSMVTGAVFATRRTLLDQVNGFDDKFSLEFNDIDLCLRLRNLGYRIVYNPDAEFVHAEKASRSEDFPPGAEVALFLSRWSRWLQMDPASHPGFDHDRVDPVPAYNAGAWYFG